MFFGSSFFPSQSCFKGRLEKHNVCLLISKITAIYFIAKGSFCLTETVICDVA